MFLPKLKRQNESLRDENKTRVAKSSTCGNDGRDFVLLEVALLAA